jgi:hypothetical protein
VGWGGINREWTKSVPLRDPEPGQESPIEWFTRLFSYACQPQSNLDFTTNNVSKLVNILHVFRSEPARTRGLVPASAQIQVFRYRIHALSTHNQGTFLASVFSTKEIVRVE